MKIGISACLLGDNCRYDGGNQLNKQIIELIKNHEIIKICPEQLSGFSTPRKPIEIKNGRAINTDGKDLSNDLTSGCLLAYEKIKDCDFLILKSKSPSCGYQKIYSGNFDGSFVQGNGYFVKLCLEHNKKIFTENDIEKIMHSL